LGAGAGDVLVVAIEGEGVFGEVGAAGGGGVRAEVVLGEGDGEGGVGGQVELGVTLAPVSMEGGVVRDGDVSEYDCSPMATYLMTAMLTGAKVLARYIWSAGMTVLLDESSKGIWVYVYMGVVNNDSRVFEGKFPSHSLRTPARPTLIQVVRFECRDAVTRAVP